MLIITSKLPWRRQPTAPVRVNWAHPLAKDLGAWMLPHGNVIINLARESIGSGCDEVIRDGFTQEAIGGDIVSVRSTYNGKITLTSGAFLQNQSELTLINWLNRTSAAGNGIAGWAFGNSAYNSCMLGINTSDQLVFSIGGVDQCGLVNYTNLPLLMIAGIFNGNLSGNSNRCKIFIDGIQQTLSFNGTIPTTTPVSLPNANLGQLYWLDGSWGLGNIGTSIIYLRALDENELRALNDNPYQMLAPTYSRRYFIPLGGGGPQTIVVTPGTETGIGSAMGMVQPRTIGLMAGSETGLGYALSITQPRSIAFTAGVETGVGYQLGLVQPRAIGLVDGQETGIGYTLGTTQPRTIGFTTGSETGVGYSLGVSAGGARTIDVTAGIETGTGYSLGVIQPRTIGVAAGSEAGVGYALGVSIGGSRTIDVTAGSETGLGYSFGVIQPRTVEFATGTETGIGYSLTIVPPGPILSVATGTEAGIGYALGVIQRGRKYRYPRPTKAIHTRHYTGRL